MRNLFEKTVRALCDTAIRERYGDAAGERDPRWERVTSFVLGQHGRMPDYLRKPFAAATLAFGAGSLLTGGRPFHRLDTIARRNHIARVRKLGPFADLIRFYEGLSVFCFGEILSGGEAAKPVAPSLQSDTAGTAQKHREVIVIGSGPGGAITAALLAEAGRDVLLLESGPHISLDETREFSTDEMERKYRNGGITAAFGRTKIAYVEGHCAGGGSEINAGLYHRTPDERLDHWRREYQLQAASPADLLPCFETFERELNVSPLPGESPLASLKLHDGALAKGWKSMEVPRWYRYEANGQEHKQSMTRTFIPRALAAGTTMLTGIRARKLRRDGARWIVKAEHVDGAKREFSCDHLFVCAGAIQTAALLQTSGIGTNIGRSLRMHPTVKVIGRFPETINSRDMGVTVHQVKEFSPRLSFGVSISRPPYISLAMLDRPEENGTVDRDWPRMAIYYAMITGGNGRVRALPGYRDPLVRYALEKTDLQNLADGARKLSEALLAAGADTLFPTIGGLAPIRSTADLARIPDALPEGRASLMSVHLFSSCPMGEDKTKCAADSFGKVHGADNLHINDASLLCTAPGVNPQGSIMAFARRNVLHFLASKGR
jgi:choline dehydrogenase-like flavoprotein